MHHFRARRRRAIVLPAILALALLSAATAWATEPPSGTVSATQTSQSFTGHVGGPTEPSGNSGFFCSVTPESCNGTPCPSQAADPTNTICEHYTLNVVGGGIVTVCVTFPADSMNMNDLDLYVIDNTTQAVVASGTSANPTQECATWPVASTGGQFEVRINPAFINLIDFPLGFTFSGTVTFQPATSGPGAAGGGAPGPGPTGRSFTGGGKLNDGSQLAMNVFDNDLTTGKVKFLFSKTCGVRVDNFTLVSVTAGPPGQGRAHVEGFDDNTGHYVIVNADDNGEPGSSSTPPDDFSIQILTAPPAQGGTQVSGCPGDSGPLSSGNLQFHPTKV